MYCCEMLKSILGFFCLMYCFETNSCYRIPHPTFTICNKRGLEVSIPDDKGINFVVFYISINKNIERGYPHYRQYVNGEVHGKWTFTKAAIKLKPGDVVYHKIFVRRYNIRYLYAGTPFVVSERVHQPKPAHPISQPEDDCYEFPAVATTIPPTTTNIPPTTRTPGNNANPLDCSLFSNTVLKILADTQKELEGVKNNQEAILEMASVQPYHLRLSGLVTELGRPKEIVESVLLEKLDSNVKIKNATKVGTTITFELFTFEQKLDIFKRAKKIKLIEDLSYRIYRMLSNVIYVIMLC
ncbi:hypothetical protein AMK59_2927 [Oryctes borbonicus]|uniref:CBM39 domain-containing protein n=1 Tax=Oryctes borbonicus TaxID=1629725 RepID=A0A0T6BEN1_9SCAR|nr:hypothetical protein AMK59_2927 [Oryctes borbonicus]